MRVRTRQIEYQMIVIKDAKNVEERVDALRIWNSRLPGFCNNWDVRKSKGGNK